MMLIYDGDAVESSVNCFEKQINSLLMHFSKMYDQINDMETQTIVLNIIRSGFFVKILLRD